MNGSLIDTNIIVKVLRGDAETIDFFDSLGEELFVSAVVVGELLYGANKSIRAEENKRLVREIISSFEVLPIDADIAEIYGQLKAELAEAGINLPENDLWIAATAQNYGLSLATLDGHFKHFGKLEVIGVA
jgi:tRNA(fMet)-specific endonuclease VapC